MVTLSMRFAVFAAVSRAASASGTALASLGRVECIPVHCPAVLTVRMLLVYYIVLQPCSCTSNNAQSHMHNHKPEEHRARMRVPAHAATDGRARAQGPAAAVIARARLGIAMNQWH